MKRKRCWAKPSVEIVGAGDENEEWRRGWRDAGGWRKAPGDQTP